MKQMMAIGVMCLLGNSAWATVAENDPVYKYLQIYTKVLHLAMTRYVEPVHGKKLVYGSLQGMLSSLDPYSMFLTPEDLAEMKRDTSGQFGGIGVEVTLYDGKIRIIAPIEGSPAHQAGILSGDRIIKIDNKMVKDLTFTEAVRLLRGSRGSSVTLVVERGSKILKFTLTRERINQASVKAEVLDKHILYLKITQFQKGTAQEARKEVQEFLKTVEAPQGIIVDVRNNPGGLLEEAISFSELFIREGSIVYTIDREGNKKVEKAHVLNTFDQVPMVVLTNSGTASASEIVGGALQDYHLAILVGQKTFGKGSVQSVIELPDGSGVKLTVAKYYTPEGRSIDQVGIIPDLQVEEVVIPPKAEVLNGEPAKPVSVKKGENLEKGEKPAKPEDKMLSEAKRVVTKIYEQFKKSGRNHLADIVKKMVKRKSI